MATWVIVSFVFFLMIRRPSRATRTDTLFPYTTLFRSRLRRGPAGSKGDCDECRDGDHHGCCSAHAAYPPKASLRRTTGSGGLGCREPAGRNNSAVPGLRRSEERRVGKECVSTCRSRWSAYHSKTKR